MNPPPVLLCSDLDRTLLPNGPAAESARARPLLRALAALPWVRLAYVSGRHLALLEEAIEQYAIPIPDYAITDVGTTVYTMEEGGWRAWAAWSEALAPDWQGRDSHALAALLAGLPELRLQEAAKQNRHKLSYCVPAGCEREALEAPIRARLDSEGLQANLIWSVDDLTHEGLLDILPASANKLHAIEFLIARQGYAAARTVFAGDSGNDLEVLGSGIQSVLVRNARPEVREAALAAAAGHAHTLYLARGGYGMNGNYAAGVLEGLAHFIPEVAGWLRGQTGGIVGDG